MQPCLGASTVRSTQQPAVTFLPGKTGERPASSEPESPQGMCADQSKEREAGSGHQPWHSGAGQGRASRPESRNADACL